MGCDLLGWVGLGWFKLDIYIYIYLTILTISSRLVSREFYRKSNYSVSLSIYLSVCVCVCVCGWG